MLENAVMPITELAQVKITSDFDTTKTGNTVTFDEYVSLLLSAVARYNAKYENKCTSHQVYLHDLLEYLKKPKNTTLTFSMTLTCL